MLSWRMSFLVYLLGVVSIIPVAMWMPNEKIVNVTSYHVAILLSLLFTLWSAFVVDRKPAK